MSRYTVVGATVLLAALAAYGCYDPKISDKLVCAAAPAKACPDGFVCSGNLCVRSGAQTGTGGRGGGTGGAGTGGRATGGAGGQCPNPIVPLCQTSSASATCDPVCQTGCGCGLRCNVTTAGLGCAPPQGAKKVGELCQSGSDDCAPGLVCLQEACGTNVARCYRYCMDGSACGTNGVCGTSVELPNGTSSGQRACDLGDSACDAVARTGCPDPALTCFMAGPNSTRCDCPSGLNRAAGENCSGYNDCAAGLTCLSVGGPARCYKLCRGNSDCAGCTIIGTAGGFCP